jgi:hypothetical protein
VTGFTSGEEEEMHLTHVVPFLVEDELSTAKNFVVFFGRNVSPRQCFVPKEATNVQFMGRT